MVRARAVGRQPFDKKQAARVGVFLPVVIAEYDPRWPSRFAQESARLQTVLHPHLLTRIEHFGSTAVPQLAAKPIIDLLVGVRSLAT
ncbi:MAG: GrpB family protein, partial [Cyanobacteria bacterium J06607_6]